MKKIVFLSLTLVAILCSIHSVLASTSDGTIDTTNRYAWSENAGWIDFGITLGNIHVTDSALTGYAYGENTGWISLNCSNTSSCGIVDYKVSNNNEGTLSGYAWSENTGWIHFAPSVGGVTIDSSGIFQGTAYGENIGWIVFNCATTSSCGTINYTIATDWRPVSSRATPSQGSGARSGSVGNYFSQYVQPITIPMLQVPSCLPGDLFNSRTGARCSGPTHTIPTLWLFTRDLQLGVNHPEVQLLQRYLNSQGYTISLSGAGSLGNETTFFGSLTQNALIKFQKEKGISPAVGYFGPITRQYISNH